MSHTVKANSLSVCTKGTPDGGSAKADPCKTPDGKVVVPENWAPCANLGAGQTTTVFIKTQPVWNANGKLDTSLYPHAGTAGGTKSGTYLMECEPTKFSPDVVFEGGGVVRMGDATLQNHQNCAGKVVPSSVGAASAEASAKAIDEALAAAKEAEAAALEEDKAADGANQEGTKKQDRDKKQDGSTTEDLCAITMAKIEDSDGRGVEENGTLEIAPDVSGESVTCTGELKGACEDQPTWKASGYHSKQETSKSMTFNASSWLVGGLWLFGLTPRTTNITFTSQQDSRSFTLKIFPADRTMITINVPKLIDSIRNGAEKVLSLATKDPIKLEFSFKAYVDAQWAEASGSPECFYRYKISGGGQPLFGITGEYPAMAVPIPGFLKKILGDAGFYVEFWIQKRLNFNFEHSAPDQNDVYVDLTGRGRFALKFKVELGSKDLLAVNVGIRATFEVPVTGGHIGGNPALTIQVVAGPLEGYITAKVGGGWFEVDKRVRIFDAKKLPSSPATVDLTKVFA